MGDIDWDWTWNSEFGILCVFQVQTLGSNQGGNEVCTDSHGARKCSLEMQSPRDEAFLSDGTQGVKAEAVEGLSLTKQTSDSVTHVSFKLSTISPIGQLDNSFLVKSP